MARFSTSAVTAIELGRVVARPSFAGVAELGVVAIF